MSGAPPPGRPGDGAASPAPARQTTAYLKRLFQEVGFTIHPTLGQNFLVDLNIVDLVVRESGLGPGDVAIEVGCGTGVLTERLAAAAARVVSAEIDPRLAQLAREGHPEPRCRVRRLMRALGLRGVVRGRGGVTTRPAPADLRPDDLVQRRFTATRPNQLWVADFT